MQRDIAYNKNCYCSNTFTNLNDPSICDSCRLTFHAKDPIQNQSCQTHLHTLPFSNLSDDEFSKALANN